MVQNFVNYYRLCKTVLNRTRGTNPFLGSLPDNVDEYFTEIVEDDDTLRSLYVTSRSTRDPHCPMNEAFREEFPPNDLAQYSAKTKEWSRYTGGRKFDAAHRAIIPDKMERRILAYFDRQIARLTEPERSPLAPSSAMRRMIFLQAGIGSGKSTMLHHMSRVLLPELREHLPYEYLPILVDFNEGYEERPLEDVKASILSQATGVLADLGGIRNADDWATVSQPELFLPDGRERPEIETAPDPAKKSRSIVHECSNHMVLLKRASRYLGSLPRPQIPLIMFDNADPLPEKRQLALVRYLDMLLHQCPYCLGLVSVREYTLGNLCNLSKPGGYRYLNRAHMTTPVLAEMVQKRFDKLMDDFPDALSKTPSITIRPGVSLSDYDVMQVYAHIGTAFRENNDPKEQDRSRASSRRFSTPGGKESVELFLHNMTNSNARMALGGVLSVLSSWALAWSHGILAYVHSRDQKGRREVPPFTIDEFLRVLCLGEYEYYDHGKNEFVQNLFAFGGRKPNPEVGRVPALLLYRALQYLENAGESVSKVDMVTDFTACFGYRKRDIETLLAWLLDHGFVESHEGSMLTRVKTLYKTRKTWFYVHTVCKLLVYLENIRNDSMISYETTPHQHKTTLTADIWGVLDFVEFVFRQELMEYAHVRKSTKRKAAFSQMIGGQPVSYKLLKSVIKRASYLVSEGIAPMSPNQRNALSRRARKLSAEMLTEMRDGNLVPQLHEYPTKGYMTFRFSSSRPHARMRTNRSTGPRDLSR